MKLNVFLEMLNKEYDKEELDKAEIMFSLVNTDIMSEKMNNPDENLNLRWIVREEINHDNPVLYLDLYK